MTDQPNGALIPVWPPTINEIVDALVKTRRLFATNGQLVWLQDGALTPVSGRMLVAIIHAHLGTPCLVNRGTAEQPRLESELAPLEVSERFCGDLLRGAETTDDRTLRALTSGRAALIDRVPQA